MGTGRLFVRPPSASVGRPPPRTSPTPGTAPRASVGRPPFRRFPTASVGTGRAPSASVGRTSVRPVGRASVRPPSASVGRPPPRMSPTPGTAPSASVGRASVRPVGRASVRSSIAGSPSVRPPGKAPPSTSVGLLRRLSSAGIPPGSVGPTEAIKSLTWLLTAFAWLCTSSGKKVDSLLMTGQRLHVSTRPPSSWRL